MIHLLTVGKTRFRLCKPAISQLPRKRKFRKNTIEDLRRKRLRRNNAHNARDNKMRHMTKKEKRALVKSKLVKELEETYSHQIRGSPIPLRKTQSRKNISPFYASGIIIKILSRLRKIRDDHVSRKNKNEIHELIFSLLVTFL